MRQQSHCGQVRFSVTLRIVEEEEKTCEKNRKSATMSPSDDQCDPIVKDDLERNVSANKCEGECEDMLQERGELPQYGAMWTEDGSGIWKRSAV